MNGKKSRAFRRKDKGVATPADLVIIGRTYQAALARSKTLPKPLVVRVRKPAKSHSPTWPGSENQFNQSRPMIVQRPVRALAKGLMESVKITKTDEVELNLTGKREVPAEFVRIIRSHLRAPKHLIDARAMQAAA